MATEPQTPSTARMIDLWLGGAHHGAVDRAAAAAFESLYPSVAREFRALRAFLGRAVRRMAAAGIDEFLVLGAGIPTRGAVHEVAPGARVLYVDIDPEVVELGRSVVAGVPGVSYVHGDAVDLATLETGEVAAALPGWGFRPTGIALLGLAAFLDDVRLRETLGRLHAAVAPGSRLAFDFDTEVLRGHPDALAFMGPNFHMRSPAVFGALLGPWAVTDEGMAPVARWGTDETGDDAPAAFCGGLAVKV